MQGKPFLTFVNSLPLEATPGETDNVYLGGGSSRRALGNTLGGGGGGGGTSGYTFEQDESGGAPTATAFKQTWFAEDTGNSYIWFDDGDGGMWVQTATNTGADGGVTLEQVRDDLATTLVAGANITITPNDGADTITIASTASGDGGDIGVLRLDDFAGADDDAKLAAALSQIGGETFKRPVALWDNRVYTFTDPVNLFNGFALIGPPRHGDQPVTTPRYPHEVKIDCGAQPFLRMPASGSVFNVHVSNLSFEAVGSTEVWMGYDPGGAAGGVLWTSNIRDVGFSLFKSVLGTPADKLLLTACTFNGFWNINNSYDVAITIGGSDNNLWTDGCLLDSDTAFTSTGNVPYHLHCDFLEKTNIGPMYITAEANPAAVRIDGSDSSGGLIFSGTRMEGRNSGQSSYGALVHQYGGRVTFRDCLFWFGGSDFTTANALANRDGEAGIVTISGGRALLDACWYARAGDDGVAETVPWVYATGASTRVRILNAEVTHDGGSFTGLPRVQAVSSATITADDSVTAL